MFSFLLGRCLRVSIYLYMSFLMPVPQLSYYTNWLLNLYLRGVSPPTLFFFKIILAKQSTCNSTCISELTLNVYDLLHNDENDGYATLWIC